MIRSVVVNAFVLLIGLVLLGFAVAIVIGYVITPSQQKLAVGPLFFFGTLGVWCTTGAIINFKRRGIAVVQDRPLRSALLVRWNVVVLVSSTGGSILWLVFGNDAPDPGPLQRAVGMVMVLSILCVPLVLVCYLVERVIMSRKQHAHVRPAAGQPPNCCVSGRCSYPGD